MGKKYISVWKQYNDTWTVKIDDFEILFDGVYRSEMIEILKELMEK